MADPQAAAPTTDDTSLGGGNYDVLLARLRTAGGALSARAQALNERRKATFGSTEPQLVATERLRTEHNCVPVDIVAVGDHLLVGFAVFLGLKSETTIADVLALHRFEPQADGSYDCSALPPDADGGFLAGEDLRRDFANLYRYYRDAGLRQLVKRDTQLLAVFQAGASWKDRKVLRWRIDAAGAITYVDDRGDRDHAALAPPGLDFEWIEITRDNQVSGRHPHYNILDILFVETVGGTLTIKVENNTEVGRGIHDEAVDDANQSLDDGRFFYAPIGKPGGLILLKILPFREERWRYFGFDPRSQKVFRVDGIGQSCRSLPEDHGIVFPGGTVLVGGTATLFDGDWTDYGLERELRSPNGEDVLYVYHRPRDGAYALYAYNLIRKEVATPIHCHGYSLFGDGRLVVFRATSNEPTRVHPLQVWKTPFTSAEHAAKAPTDGSYLAKVGNADLVRGLSDVLSIGRLTTGDTPTRQTFEDILALATRAVDTYYWLGHADAGDLKSTVGDVKAAARLILDEYDKVIALRGEAARVLAEAEQQVADRLRDTRSESWDRVEPFLAALTALRGLRGHLITMRDVRFIDTARITALEAQVASAFDRITADCSVLLARGEAFQPLVAEAGAIAGKVAALSTAAEVKPLRAHVDEVAAGLALLGEIIASLKIDDTTRRTAILENVTEAFGHVNRARATVEGRQRDLAGKEGRAEFGAQVKLLTQAVSSALAQCDTPERCDQELTRLLVQVEELEARFADIDELGAELTAKREEIVDAVGAKKQQLSAERQRRSANLVKAAQRILDGVVRRAQALATGDEINAFFASDQMVMKLRDLLAELAALGDAVKAEELDGKLKVARQDALRGQRDKADLFDDGGDLIRFGDHRFAVNQQALELMIVPHEDHLALHLAGTDFFEVIDDARLEAARPLWHQDLPSETAEVYRGEYLAAQLLADAEAGAGGHSLEALHAAVRDGRLEAVVRAYAQERYDEGYDRGVHDHDAARILDRALALSSGAGLLSYPAAARALAVLFWSSADHDAAVRTRWQRRAASLGRLANALGDRGGQAALAAEIAAALAGFATAQAIPGIAVGDAPLAAAYLVRELAADLPRFAVSGPALTVRDALLVELDARSARIGFEADVEALAGAPAEAVALVRAWLDGVVAHRPDLVAAGERDGVLIEAAALVVARRLDREPSSATTATTVDGLLGRHPRIESGTLRLRLDEFLGRLGAFRRDRVPAFRAYRALRVEIAEREKRRLRLDELRPRVMSSFVRNRLIDQVYLPLVGANLAKQLGAAGAGKRTDQMGLLLLVSPPGYGKTTLMEYVAQRLGLAFVKVNGPALGHEVTSVDPAEAPNATARQEIDKVNLALEMGSNVMLYLDDIQHTSPELLQKFISLCDAQRKVEGVWKGRTRTYDLRGKKFCIVMAGNPYTESGEQFRIPDMLANRADVYNLGDVLAGKADAFALSYLENALTSSPTLAPLATRDLADVYKLVRMARGEPVPASELSHGYPAVELAEIQTVLRHLLRVQTTLLMVNQEYIRSAAQADAFRTEPPFKLQGSYRNMNKIAEKVVAAMTDDEVERLVDDHYRGESQTLTTAAEQNLLKLADMRGRLTPEMATRWTEMKTEFVRQRRMGGGDDDPVTRLVGTLGGLGAELASIRDGIVGGFREALGNGQGVSQLAPELRALRDVVAAAAMRASADAAAKDPEDWLGPRFEALTRALAEMRQPVSIEVMNQAPPGVQELLEQQILLVEKAVMPVVHAVARDRGDGQALAAQMMQIIELLQDLDARMRAPRA
jgi:hypothetical protein